MKTNEGTSQLEKGFVRSRELLPTDQEPARTIEPGEQSLNDPSSWLFGHFQRYRWRIAKAELGNLFRCKSGKTRGSCFLRFCPCEKIIHTNEVHRRSSKKMLYFRLF